MLPHLKMILHLCHSCVVDIHTVLLSIHNNTVSISGLKPDSPGPQYCLYCLFWINDTTLDQELRIRKHLNVWSEQHPRLATSLTITQYLSCGCGWEIEMFGAAAGSYLLTR